MARFISTGPSWLARKLFDLAVRLHPRYADPHNNPVPEIVVVENGRAGAYLLRQLRDYSQHHLSVYWPGRGESYIAGRPAARVTILSGGDRLSSTEREMLRQRTLSWGERALWLED